MTTLATSLALCASALTQRFQNDEERQHMSRLLLRLSGDARELERFCDEMVAEAAEAERTGATRVVRLAPALSLVDGGAR